MSRIRLVPLSNHGLHDVEAKLHDLVRAAVVPSPLDLFRRELTSVELVHIETDQIRYTRVRLGKVDCDRKDETLPIAGERVRPAPRLRLRLRPFQAP